MIRDQGSGLEETTELYFIIGKSDQKFWGLI